ncbi:hypothetical protein TRIUR3_12948 [Triticum urartu]|uniref:Pentatricopeptide repeat-containing protein n=1 Tax=Triticum urartu TaxID=4572 RepID=M7ZEG8_TRIUA|nr:hypothetical protein TRIUR3_12948 [Triticum urartu]
MGNEGRGGDAFRKGTSFGAAAFVIRPHVFSSSTRLLKRIQLPYPNLLYVISDPTWHARHHLKVRAVLRAQAQTDARAAFEFFRWADRQWCYRHAPEVFDEMLSLLGRTRLHDPARRVMRLMIHRRMRRGTQQFAHLMLSYSRAGKLRSAMRVLQLMQKDGVRRVVEALEMIGVMLQNGCPPDKITYYTVMGFLCKEKRVAEVRGLLGRMMNDAGLFPDQVTYNMLIHVFAKHGHADEALEFLRELEGKRFRVDEVGYSAVVHSFCLNGRMAEAKEIVGEMISKECHPDVVTYSAVVDGFCRIEEIDQARKMMKHMLEFSLY